MYRLEFRRSVEKIFHRLAKKQPRQLEIIAGKIDEIRRDPTRFKNLRKPLQQFKRVHIDRNFVLVFSVDVKGKTVIIEDYDHHDKIYQKSALSSTTFL